jgi:hypothetical protein
MLTIFTCNDMEAAWIAQICADGEYEMAEWERQEDLDHEEQLARDAVEDDATDVWPWYADAPLEVEESEIIEDADLLGLPVGGRDEDFDDELTVEALEAEDESHG